MSNLILKRKNNQAFVIQTPHGCNVWVTVYEIKAGSCKVSISAPDYVRIDREEIYQAKLGDGK